MIRRTKLLIRRYILQLKTDHPGSYLVRVIWVVHRLVSDTPLVLMVKYTDGPTVWSDGSRNKYDPGLSGQWMSSACRAHR